MFVSLDYYCFSLFYDYSIKAYDVERPERGPVFRVEVTVVQPQAVDLLKPELKVIGEIFEPNTIRRHFVFVPEEVTWATIRLRAQEPNQSGRFVVHCIQLRPKKTCKTIEYHKMVNVCAEAEATLSFQVKVRLCFIIMCCLPLF